MLSALTKLINSVPIHEIVHHVCTFRAMCECVCVCVWLKNMKSGRRECEIGTINVKSWKNDSELMCDFYPGCALLIYNCTIAQQFIYIV